MSELEPIQFRSAAALIVGISRYERSGRVTTLRFADRDAAAMAKVLCEPAVCNLAPQKVMLLTDTQATRQGIVNGLSSWLPTAARGSELAIIYFAGHGIVHQIGNSEEGFLLPHDGNPEDPIASGIAMQDVARWIGLLNARAVVVILDCCHAGKLLPAGVALRGAARDVAIRPRELERMAGRGRFLIASCDDGQQSLEAEDLGHGLFTYHLLDGINGKADLDQDGKVNVSELFSYVSREVSTEAIRRFGREQSPWCSSTSNEDHYIASRAAGYHDALGADGTRRPWPGDMIAAEYRVMEEVGRGPDGGVFLVRDRAGREWAAKVFPHRRMSSGLAGRLRELARAPRLRMSAAAVPRRLESDRELIYFVREYVDGWNLARFVREHSPNLAESLQIMADVCRAVYAADEAGIAHRDLKPQNVLIRRKKLTERWEPVVVDFGLSWSSAGEETSPDALGESGRFVAPEQYHGPPAATDSRADVFAIGVMLYRLLSERFPYRAEDLRRYSDSPFALQPEQLLIERPSRPGTGVPVEVAEAISLAISLDPLARFRDCRELALALDGFLERLRRPALAAPTAGPGSPTIMVLMSTELVWPEDLEARIAPAQFAHLIRRHEQLFHQATDRISEVQVLSRGQDGLLVRFAVASDAVNAALIFQHLVEREHRQGVPLRIRVGIHVGEVVELPNESGGAMVVGLAGRVCRDVAGLAQPGQILMTSLAFEAREFVRSHPEVDGGGPPGAVEWRAHGPYEMRGRGKVLELFEVGATGIGPLAAPPGNDKWRPLQTDLGTVAWRPGGGKPIPERMNWILDRKLGEGGFGEVWVATHNESGRQRAFKFCFDAARLRTFKQEIRLAKALGKLGQRDDLVSFEDVNTQRSPFYLESEYVPAGNLGEWFDARGGILGVPLEKRVQILRRVAEAVAAAHSVGVVHRDLKPSNILMGTGDDGSPRPRLTDFGLGMLSRAQNEQPAQKSQDSISIPTQGGNRMYDPPESIINSPYTKQGDVYALGVLLYQLVAGNFLKPLGIGWERDVEDPILREDIAAAVDVEPGRRLPDAKELVVRLKSHGERRERLREMEATRAAEQSAKSRKSEDMVQANERAAWAQAMEAAEAARSKLASVVLGNTTRALFRRDYPTALLWACDALRIEPADSPPVRRLRTTIGTVLRRISANVSRSLNVQLADSDKLAAEIPPVLFHGPEALREIRLTPVGKISPDLYGANVAAFSPDGQTVATAAVDGTVRFWRTSDGKPAGPTLHHELGVTQIQYRRDGKAIAVACNDDTARIWDLRTDRCRTLPHADMVTVVCFGRGGEVLLTGTESGVARVWDATQGTPLTPEMHHGGAIRMAAFLSPGIVTAGEGRSVRFWTEGDGTTCPFEITLASDLMAIDVHHKSRRLVTVERSGRLLVHSLHDLAPLWPMPVELGPRATHCAFSPDGRLVLAVYSGGLVGVWDADTSAPVGAVMSHTTEVRYACFSPDSQFVCTTQWDGRVMLWSAQSGELIAPAFAQPKPVFHAVFSPDGNRIAVSGADGCCVCNVEPETRSADTLWAVATVLSRCRIDEAGGVHRLQPSDLKAVLRQLLPP